MTNRTNSANSFGDIAGPDLTDLKVAKSKLEYPGLTARISDLLGRPIEAGFKLLPADWNQRVSEITQAALLRALEFALRTIGDRGTRMSRDWIHKVLVTGSGIAGGAAGVAALAVELPVSTTIILRSIADIARSEGHDVSLLEIKLACLEVLAFGGRSARDDSSAEGYWAVRAALAKAISEATAYLAERGLSEKGAPPLVRVIAAISSRFGSLVTEEVAAKAVPVVGAAAGGTINFLFMEHFQEMARGHFIIKRLEKKYGIQAVEAAYRELVV